MKRPLNMAIPLTTARTSSLPRLMFAILCAVITVAGTADYNTHQFFDKAEARDPVGSDDGGADVFRTF